MRFFIFNAMSPVGGLPGVTVEVAAGDADGMLYRVSA